MEFKKLLLESKTSELQKKLVKYLDPKHLLQLEEYLNEIVQVERLTVKVAQRLNVRPGILQATADDLLDIIHFLQM